MTQNATGSRAGDSHKIEVVDHFKNKWWRLNNLYHIINEHGKKVKFRCNPLQKKFYDNLWYLNMLLKARQFGGTTFTDIYFLDDCIFTRNLEAGIIAHNRDDAQKIFRRKVKFPYDNLPDGLKSQCALTTDSRQELAFSNGSVIYVATSIRSGTVQRLHICLSGDTEILIKDGFVKRIDKIKAGELVLTGDGDYQPVMQLIENKFKDIGHEQYSLKIFGYYKSLKLTGNHKVLTPNRMKAAQALTCNDYLGIPKKSIMDANNGSMFPHDFNFGWLCGFYLAEGNIRSIHGKLPTRTVFSIHPDKTKILLKRIKSLNLQDKIKKGARRITVRKNRPGSKTIIVEVNSRSLAHYISSLFGSGIDKHIIDEVWNCGKEFCDGLVKGYFDGDGCYVQVSEISICSIRRNLIDQMKLLLISLDIGVGTIYHRDAGFYYGRNCSEIWTLKLYGDGNIKFREYFKLPEWKPSKPYANQWKRGDKHYWCKIQDIKTIPANPNDLFYDIVLNSEPHSFYSNNGVLANSEHAKICRKYPDKSEEIKTGSLNAIHPGNIVVIESTAEGRHGDFYDFCQIARKAQQAGKTLSKMDYRFHFFPWFWDIKNALDIEGVVITAEMQGYFDKIEGGELDQDGKSLRLTAGQKAWYVKKEAILGEKMLQEYPSTVEESFQATIRGAYFATEMAGLRKRHQITTVPYETGLPVNTAWDLGVRVSPTSSTGGATVIVFHQRHRLENRIIDYYINNDRPLAHYVKILREKGYLYGTHYLPHDVGITSLSTGKTRLATLRKLMPGERLIVNERSDLADGIETTRNFLPTCWLDEVKCAALIDALDAYQRQPDDKHGGFKDKPLHNWASDPADGFRSLAVGYNPSLSGAGRRRRRPVNAMAV